MEKMKKIELILEEEMEGLKLMQIKEKLFVLDTMNHPIPGEPVYSEVSKTIVIFTDPRHFSEGTYQKVAFSERGLIAIDVPEIHKKNFEILIPFPKSDGCRDGKEINTWMKGWEEGYRECQKTHFTKEEVLGFLNYYRNNNSYSITDSLKSYLEDLVKIRVEIEFDNENKPVKASVI